MINDKDLIATLAHSSKRYQCGKIAKLSEQFQFESTYLFPISAWSNSTYWLQSKSEDTNR